MDFNEKDSGRLVGHLDWQFLFPFDHSRMLPVGGSSLVPHSLLVPPVLREFMPVATILPGQTRSCSQSFP